MAFGNKRDDEKNKSQAPKADTELDASKEGQAATPAEGEGDQGHGEGDSKKTALETAQQIQAVDRGSQARGVITVNDPNPHERFDAQGFRTNTRYQSDAAREALLNPEDADRINEHNIQEAEIGSTASAEVLTAIDLEALNKKIIVKPRQTVQRFRIGDTWYSLQDGKDVLVPQHVAIILAEKGII
jgi:hypothetical protein